ncbi:MAG: hypothetical protein Q7R39_07790 [Dehalococcoidia bacterium]|nr:hypothetical protein [Dehalococcoidia bacterium]
MVFAYNESSGALEERADMGTQLVSNLDLLCQGYVKRISGLEMVFKVIAVEDMEVITVWTVIDAPPFEDSLRQPIYQAQLQALREVKGDLALDFYVVNIAELAKPVQLASIIPSDAKVLWQR